MDPVTQIARDQVPERKADSADRVATRVGEYPVTRVCDCDRSRHVCADVIVHDCGGLVRCAAERHAVAIVPGD